MYGVPPDRKAIALLLSTPLPHPILDAYLLVFVHFGDSKQQQQKSHRVPDTPFVPRDLKVRSRSLTNREAIPGLGVFLAPPDLFDDDDDHPCDPAAGRCCPASFLDFVLSSPREGHHDDEPIPTGTRRFHFDLIESQSRRRHPHRSGSVISDARLPHHSLPL
ncbi:hypothetical protein SODALDRAFT_356371 [Sodiomyces alkalinus F11]|uniref:Uncharacterized protein n=1 Tax=Sodiomyces alkalinus (strain CBS 110278 / VKM F-3762 / F11) TaxID=1314773 RepID=A0A3N2Q117_SODAK|nr:hypothetical protein SODALDRAFT_356371 [Sodiomyces alkalinus F11]ROT40388.1 hypothetical protein SODALDRAFT_356371 [Sodiomyces alkalinus F11]